jgi:hypothetical protein
MQMKSHPISASAFKEMLIRGMQAARGCPFRDFGYDIIV